jgi:hypothetical protein
MTGAAERRLELPKADAHPIALPWSRSELRRMDWQDGAGGFDFRDTLARDHDIRLAAVADFRALVEDGNCDLPDEGHARVYQFSAQIICGLQQSEADMSVYLDRHPDHPFSQRLSEKRNALSVSTVLSALSPC